MIPPESTGASIAEIRARNNAKLHRQTAKARASRMVGGLVNVLQQKHNMAIERDAIGTLKGYLAPLLEELIARRDADTRPWN